MENLSIVGIVCAVILLGEGLYGLFAGKTFGSDKDAYMYEPDSVTRSNRLSGFFFTLGGIMFLLEGLHIDFIPGGLSKWIQLAVIIVVCVLGVVCTYALRKRKPEYQKGMNAKKGSRKDKNKYDGYED